MISDKTKHQFLYNSMRATRLAYLDLARNMFCKKWAELRGNTLEVSGTAVTPLVTAVLYTSVMRGFKKSGEVISNRGIVYLGY
jgi:hypothetical protein